MQPNKPTRAKVQIVKNGPYLVSGTLSLQKQTIGTNFNDTWKASR
jgi:hypothetical protein